jgi:hypothetical protein
MSVLENKIQAEIRLALGAEPDLVLWRNSTGMVETAEVGRDGIVGGRAHRFGIAVGSADLIGILSGRFVALEVKRPGQKPRPEQVRWLECVRRFGGFAASVDSVESAKAAIERARKGESQ